MYKLFLTLVAILILGAGLSLSLPPFQPSSDVSASQNYQIDQKSLSSPFPLDAFYLKTPLPKEALFTLQLGLYDQLPQAIAFIKTLPSSDNYLIVKATDKTRFWYLVLKGKYKQQEKALFEQQSLNNSQIASSLMLFPT